MGLRQAVGYLLVVLCTGLFALEADAACTGKLTDLQSTAGMDGFSLFYQGLVAVNASDIIKNTSTLTLLAPTDAAFSTGMQAIGLPVSPSSWNEAERNLARGILFYHILPGQPGQYLNRSNAAELRKTLVSKVDTFVCGPGSVDIPLNDTDPIDNISAVTLDFSDNSTISVIGIYKNATANVTEFTDACFTGISIYLLNGVILPCNTNSPCALAATVSDDLMRPGLPMLAALIGKQIPEQMANGTILLPTNAALNKTMKAIISLIGNSTTTTTTTMDPATIMLSLPQFKDVLAYHIIAGVNIGDTPTTGVKTTLLKSYTQSFCTTASAGTVTVTRTASGNITFTDAIGTVANATLLGESCNGIVWEIDAVLLPCGALDSIIAALIKAPAASPKASPAPGFSPSASPKAGTSPAPGTSPSPTTGAAPVTTPGAWTAIALAASLVVLLLSH